ncbi:hypothetical protein A2899_04320 [Candidatus Amesbacteria bacterium RIFCSPLOWO2_01_FULL_49_25]|nr:MAG: hypothetical protein A2899_04320 [Candidatus Amesbacteria bacterium RIFCSPLOWO2_01_FULL_49_25]
MTRSLIVATIIPPHISRPAKYTANPARVSVQMLIFRSSKDISRKQSEEVGLGAFVVFYFLFAISE